MQERNISWFPSISTWTQDRTHRDQDVTCNLGMCPDQDSNPQPFSYRTMLQPTESHWPGLWPTFLLSYDSIFWTEALNYNAVQLIIFSLRVSTFCVLFKSHCLLNIIMTFLINLLIFRQRGRGRKRGRETSMCVAYWAPGPQPRHVP